MRDRKNLLIIILIATVVVMSVGYAAFAQRLSISGTANIANNWNVKITDIHTRVLTGASVREGSPTFTDTSANFEVDLEYPGASASFDITIENAGSINAVLDNIYGLSTANSYDPSYIVYSVTDINIGDRLDAGDKTTATVTVTWDPSYEQTPEEPVSKTATITLDYLQAE